MTVLISVNICFADSFQTGINAYNQQDYGQAESYFQRAVQSEPNNVTIKYYLAVTLVKNNKFRAAQREYSSIIKIAPDSDEANLARQGLKYISSTTNKKITKAEINITNRNSSILVPNVRINNRYTTGFILDTGATFTSITTDMANKLGINKRNLPRVTVTTANGTVRVPKTVLHTITINGLTAKNVEVIIMNTGTPKGITGLLGLSFLQQFKVTIDKKQGKLILER